MYSFCYLCLSLQICKDPHGFQTYGLGSLDSVKFGDVDTTNWTFTMSYSNAAQGKTSHVAYTLAPKSETTFDLTSQYLDDMFVSWCSL